MAKQIETILETTGIEQDSKANKNNNKNTEYVRVDGWLPSVKWE